ncbi:MAG: thiamine-phosphate kinase [Gammaproteobacteria bacterium]|nr:thiamine-phosphate kinase [Gammaproteobacteria bacterium]
MDEFDLIKRYFQPLESARGDVDIGIGDDAAVVAWDSADAMVIAVDTLVEGVHFPPGMAADAVGYKAVAVNLSDFAAMGAMPRYATLALTLPRVDADWLESFANGLNKALVDADTVLVGGDTTRGPLTVTVQLVGPCEGAPMTRAGARPDDVILVSGSLGDARAGLELLRGNMPPSGGDERALIRRFLRPEARLELGRACRIHAHAAIDISDGLLADVAHVMTASACRAELEIDMLPLSAALTSTVERGRALQYAVAGGDDYELALCVPPAALDRVLEEANRIAVPLTSIGRVVVGEGVICRDAEGADVTPRETGYVHFD